MLLIINDTIYNLDNYTKILKEEIKYSTGTKYSINFTRDDDIFDSEEFDNKETRDNIWDSIMIKMNVIDPLRRVKKIPKDSLGIKVDNL
jgi:hypothetical protein